MQFYSIACFSFIRVWISSYSSWIYSNLNPTEIRWKKWLVFVFHWTIKVVYNVYNGWYILLKIQHNICNNNIEICDERKSFRWKQENNGLWDIILIKTNENSLISTYSSNQSFISRYQNFKRLWNNLFVGLRP